MFNISNIKNTNRDINSLQPVAKKAARLFLDVCKERGLDIFVTEYHRSQERQDYLYEQGRSRDGQIVTWTRKSNHTGGYAWDIACSPPQNLYDNAVIAKAGSIAVELGIEWGGNWKERDTPHFQVDSGWKPPTKLLNPKQELVRDMCNKYGLDESWINKWNDNVTVYELFAVIGKVAK